ncbi:MAG: hypothetical protein H0W83_00305 [Planctomycetes bacterium]|nr:hypothetical protein [Planctomycetota bacterium]
MTVTRIGYRPTIAKRFALASWFFSAAAVVTAVQFGTMALPLGIAGLAILMALCQRFAARRPAIEIDDTTVVARRGLRRFSMRRTDITGIRQVGRSLLIEGAGGPITLFAADVDATAEQLQHIISGPLPPVR